MNYYAMPGYSRKETKYTAPELIIRLVCNAYKIKVEKVFQKTRKKPIAEARQVCVCLLRRNTTLNGNEIAGIFGIHHTTVIHSIKTVIDRETVEEDTRKLIQKIQSVIR